MNQLRYRIGVYKYDPGQREAFIVQARLVRLHQAQYVWVDAYRHSEQERSAVSREKAVRKVTHGVGFQFYH